MSLTGYGKIADSPGPAVLLMLFAVVVLAVPSVVVAADMSPGAAAVDWESTGTRAVEYLREYIRHDTTNPPGNVLAAGRFLQSILEENGIETEWFESEPGVTANLLARLPASGEVAGGPILLLHHMDVVPADASRWQRNPFGGDLDDGAVWGRGAMDMKGIGIIHLMTMLTMKQQGIPLDRDLLFMAVADEEVGGARGARWMLEHHPDLLDVAIVFDEGGFGARDVLAEGRLVFNVSVAEKKIVWLRLTAEGTAGHGSQPHDANPNDHLVAALARVLALPAVGEEPPVVQELRQRVGPLAVNKFTHAITHTTTSLSTLRSGVGDPPKVNVIPSTATATLDNRLLPGLTADEFVERVRGAVNDPTIRIDVTYESGGTPVTAWDSRMFDTIETVVRRHHPTAVVTPSPIPYGTDSNTFRLRGAEAYGFIPVIVDLGVISSMHSDAERLPAAEFRLGVEIFHEIIRDFASGGRSSR